MADPKKFTPGYSYSGWQANNPTKPLPANQIDNDFAGIAESVNGAVSAITDIRRSDGALKNQIVTIDSLHATVRLGLGANPGAVAELLEKLELKADAEEVAESLALKADAEDVYDRGDIDGFLGTRDAAIALKAAATSVYTKTQIDTQFDLLDAATGANPMDYGAKGDGVTDDTAAFQACFNANTYVVVPARKFILSAELTKTGELCLRGAGRGSRLYWQAGAASRGIRVTANVTAGVRSMVYVDGVRLTTMAAATDGKAAIAVYGSQANDRFTPSAYFNNIHVDGDGGSFTRGWGVGLDLRGCQGAFVENCHFWGQLNGDLAHYTSLYGFRFWNPENLSPHPTEFHVTNCTAKCVGTGIYADDMEGMLVLNCELVGVDVGVRARGLSEFPHVSVTSCHINATHDCIVVDKMHEAIITGNLLYNQGTIAAGTTGVTLTNSARYFTIVGNQLECYADFPMNGVVVGAGCGDGVIASNIFRRMNSLSGTAGLGVWLVAGSSKVYVAPDNLIDPAFTTTDVLDAGTGNFVPGYGSRFGKSADQSIAAGSLSIVTFPTTVSIRGNPGVPSSGAFTVPSTGLWQFTTNLQLDTAGQGGVIVNFQKNATSGAAIASVAANTTAGIIDVLAVTSAPIRCVAGDVIRVGMNPGNARTVSAVAATYFEATRLS